jgi:dolichyl-phosphate-mannose-protein mannosyltransferase
MYLYVSAESQNRSPKKALLCLALSGVSFGLGAASKWTSIYAGGGLAVIWAAYWITNYKKGIKAFIKNVLFCLVFFVCIPALIYYVSYTPYGTASGLHGLSMYFSKEYLDIVISNQEFMFSYHSNLVAEHPYSSEWYKWIFDIRPILYYLDYFDDGTRSSFGAFVNPLLCWAGLISLFVLIYTSIFRRDKTATFILVGYLAQLLPWILVKRLTFEYHYFPCTVFLLLSLGYSFKLIRTGNRRWRLYLGGFAALSAALYILFYPALSGLVVDNATASKLLDWLPTWPF